MHMSEENITKGMSKEEFLSEVKRFNPYANIGQISKAYDFAKRVHGDQKRASGEDHFTHLLEVSYLLAELRLDSDTVTAGLLHDTIEDTGTKAKTLEDEFGKEIRL